MSLPKFYLFPSLVPKDGLISLANIMQIWFPQNLDKAISMGEIGMLVADSNLDNKSVELQREIYLVLRKQLRMRFMKGVWGRNSKTGRDNFYKNILISENGKGCGKSWLNFEEYVG